MSNDTANGIKKSTIKGPHGNTMELVEMTCSPSPAAIFDEVSDRFDKYLSQRERDIINVTISVALDRIPNPVGPVQLSAITEAAKALCLHTGLFINGFEGNTLYSDEAREQWRDQAIAAAQCVVGAYLDAIQGAGVSENG